MREVVRDCWSDPDCLGGVQCPQLNSKGQSLHSYNLLKRNFTGTGKLAQEISFKALVIVLIAVGGRLNSILLKQKVEKLLRIGVN